MFFEDPKYTVQYLEDAVNVEVELPGFSGDELDISTERNLLTIYGQRRGRNIKLVFTIPPAVTADGVTAYMEHGILRVCLPIAESQKKRKIPVTQGRPQLEETRPQTEQIDGPPA